MKKTLGANAQQKTMTGKPPAAKFVSGGVCATIWENTNAEGVEYHTVSFERRYKDKNDEWQGTNSLRVADIPKAVLVLSKAYELLALKEDGE